METHFKLRKHTGNKAILLTHGWGSSIESSTLGDLEESFYNKGFTTYSLDLFGHGKSEGNAEDLTLSICYAQILEGIMHLENIGMHEIYLYGTSLSSLPILKAGIEKRVKKVFLKSPIIDYYKKRLKDVGGEEKMKKWEKDGIISIGINFKTGEKIMSKYVFIEDYIAHFKNIFEGNMLLPVFICSGILDEEIDIKDLMYLSKNHTNYTLSVLEETHNFSNEGSKKFVELCENQISLN